MVLNLSTEERVKELVLRKLVHFLEESDGATFNEIYVAISQTIDSIKKTYLREILRELILKGVVERSADYERKQVIFKLSSR